MFISVIIPTLNEERVLPRTLAHTLALGFDELLVVDGGSNDRTAEIVTASRVTREETDAETRREEDAAIPASPRPCVPVSPAPVTLLTAPAGRATQMNIGATASRGDILLFLHADTLLPRDAKREIEEAMKEPACVGGRFDLCFERDMGLGWLISRLINLRSRWTGIATGDQAIFVRRRTFDELGGFSPIPIMEDIDFTSRLKQTGRVVSLRSKVITSYRRWKTRGSIRTIVLMWSLRFLYWIGVSPHKLSQLYSTVR